MEESSRQAIAVELTTLKQELQINGATPEDMAIAFADYFIEQQL